MVDLKDGVGTKSALRVCVAVASVAGALTLVGPATAANSADSGWVRYLEWTHNGAHHRAAHRSRVAYAADIASVWGGSGVRYRSGSSCTADAVPAGWLAVRGSVYDSYGNNCATLGGWVDNGSSASGIEVDAIEGKWCGRNRSFRMHSRGEVYRSNYGGFAASSWLDSPWLYVGRVGGML